MARSARDQILGAIRASHKRGPLDGDAAEPARVRLETHPRGLIPARSRIAPAEQVALFVEMAQAVAATVDRVDTLADVPDSVADFLAGHNLPAAIKVAPDPDLRRIPWAKRPVLEVAAGKAEDPDIVSVTGAVAGVAETGTLMLASGPDSPTTLNFLPDNHIVVLRTTRIVGPYEDAWDRLRARGDLPRTVNLITGPSRTGDIEQVIQLGAHGPRRLHIVLVDRDDAA